jgi:uncharacterized protein (DUF362 family)
LSNNLVHNKYHPDPSLVGLSYDFSKRREGRFDYYNTDVRKLIKEALINGGLGKLDINRPLADIIEPGMKVLLKPNWVLHYNQSGKTLDCSITHHKFIIAVLKEVIACRPEVVLIADAPIQNAVFSKIISYDVQKELKDYGNINTHVEIKDFRGTIAINKRGILYSEKNPDKKRNAICFDLGKDSFLKDISSIKGKFRNTGYNPDVMSKNHTKGKHLYRLCKEPFEFDVFLNLPKLKCHGKAGISVALKNIVGINADKDSLPHHRIGGSTWGGDCYNGLKPLKRLSELFLDKANSRIGYPSYFVFTKLAAASIIFHKLIGDGDLEGKWYGNDTVWRMVLDINRLLLYGTKEGDIKDTTQRTIYSITDGILSGEHNGPLAPEPLPIGIVTFGSCSSVLDIVHAGLFHFDWEKIPLLRESFRNKNKYPLVFNQPEEIAVQTGDKKMSFKQSSKLFGVSAQPPDGWKNYIENEFW